MKIQQAFRKIVAPALALLSLAAGAEEGKPWMNRALDPDRRAELVVAQMTREEKQTLVFGYFGTDAPWKKYHHAPEARRRVGRLRAGHRAPGHSAAVDHRCRHRRGHAGWRKEKRETHGVAVRARDGGDLGSGSWRAAPAR